MASCLIAAIDATGAAEAYAEASGATVRFSSEDVRTIANTLYISHGKEIYATAAAGSARTQEAAQWRQ